MDISVLNDRELLSQTKILVQKETQLTLQIIEHLEEIDARRLYSDLKYSSLFEYCVHELGYSRHQTYRRIEAMKFCKKMPAVKEEITKQNVTLTTVNLLSDYVRDAKIDSDLNAKSTLIEMAKGKSKREVEKSLIELRKENGIEDKLPNKTVVSKTEDQVRLHLTLKKSTMDKLTKIKNLLSHQKPNADLEDILDFFSDEVIEKLEKKKFGAANKTAFRAPASTQNNTRYIAAVAKREVYANANGKCQNCGSTYQLELDHIKSFATGGSGSPANIQLLCKKCNQAKATKEFGRDKMTPYLTGFA